LLLDDAIAIAGFPRFAACIRARQRFCLLRFVRKRCGAGLPGSCGDGGPGAGIGALTAAERLALNESGRV